jgi:hypothetical protein
MWLGDVGVIGMSHANLIDLRSLPDAELPFREHQ